MKWCPPSHGPDERITEIFGRMLMMRDVEFMLSRAILGARNVDVDLINEKATAAFPGEVCFLQTLPWEQPGRSLMK